MSNKQTNMRTVGTCGNCGGAVIMPTVYLSIIPPAPRCESCGGMPKANHGPVVEMERPRDLSHTTYPRERCK